MSPNAGASSRCPFNGATKAGRGVFDTSEKREWEMICDEQTLACLIWHLSSLGPEPDFELFQAHRGAA